MIVIQNFSKAYSKNKYAIKDLNLTIDNGDICAFVGHNGAGKTTTLKCIVGILDFKEGDIFSLDRYASHFVNGELDSLNPFSYQVEVLSFD